MVTFDGADHHSRDLPVRGARLQEDVRAACLALQAHVTGVPPFHVPVGRMVLLLREDGKGRLLLLWCSSLRLLSLPPAAGVRRTEALRPASVMPSGARLRLMTLPAPPGRAVDPPELSVSAGARLSEGRAETK
jgi:hypothetical protein